MSKSTVRTSGGQPNGLPDFNPINLRGELPTRTREMPARSPAPEVDLFQLWVERKSGAPIAIGPKGPKMFLEPLLTAINAQISLGKENRWSNPHLLRAEPDLEALRYAGRLA